MQHPPAAAAAAWWMVGIGWEYDADQAKLAVGAAGEEDTGQLGEPRTRRGHDRLKLTPRRRCIVRGGGLPGCSRLSSVAPPSTLCMKHRVVHTFWRLSPPTRLVDPFLLAADNKASDSTPVGDGDAMHAHQLHLYRPRTWTPRMGTLSSS